MRSGPSVAGHSGDRRFSRAHATLACVQAKVVSPQALSEALAPLWAFLNRRSSHELLQVLVDLDSSVSQVKMLFLLEDGGEHSVKEIATALELSLPAVSRAIDGLVEKGFVTRRESTEDRRSRIVALTELGTARVTTIIEARLRKLEDFAALLTDEERTRLYEAVLPIVERIARQ
jgi:DNA-binding MarR family transcriptional regulator